jgi:hypothetical protein
MLLRKIPQQLDKKTDVSHLVHQVLVFQLLRQDVAQRLVERCCALAMATDKAVVDHLTCLALQILHLVSYHPPIQNLDQTSLNLALV